MNESQNDKLMLWNEGRLPEDFTIETLLGKHPSRPFNKNVADIFFKAGFIEAWGRDIAKITNGFKNEGLRIPEFEAAMGGIMVIIDRPGYNLKDSDTDKVTDKVTDNQQKIILAIKENDKVSTSDLAEIVGISQRKIKENMAKLKEYGIIERIGPAKGGSLGNPQSKPYLRNQLPMFKNAQYGDISNAEWIANRLVNIPSRFN